MLALLLLFSLEDRVRQSGTGCTALLRFGTGTGDEALQVAREAARDAESPIKKRPACRAFKLVCLNPTR